VLVSATCPHAALTYPYNRSSALALSRAIPLALPPRPCSARAPFGHPSLTPRSLAAAKAACLLREHRAVIDHMLYWVTPASEAEASYLAAILNSEAARVRVEQYQARGGFGARHFDKVIFNLPIPRFDAREKLHLALAAAAVQAEKVAAVVALPEAVKFQRARRIVRAALSEAEVAQRIDALVAKLLDAA
jgi:hypothetical protein